MVDWLSTSGGCEIEEDDRSVRITSRQYETRLRIVAATNCEELIIHPHRPLFLVVDDEVEIPEAFRLIVVPQSNRAGRCDIRASIRHIRCESAVEYPKNSGPAIGLAHSAHVEYTGGCWSLDAAYNADPSKVNITITNDHDDTDLSCSLPVGLLSSKGDHSLSLRRTEGTVIKIVAGSPTFETPLHKISMSGTGGVVVKGNITDSIVDLSGSLKANGDVTGTAIDIDDTLTVTGGIVLDTRELTCGTAHISGSLDSRAKVRASSLTVQAGIAGTSEIETHDLSCEGPLSAGKVTATGATKIHGNAQCDQMRCEGDIELHGTMAELRLLKWIVADGDCRMSMRRAADDGASEYLPLPEVLVTGHGGEAGAPQLDLGIGIDGIEQPRVDVPRISISVESIPKGTTASTAEELGPRVGLTLERRDVEIGLQSGVLLCSLPAGEQQPFSVDCARKSVLVLSELNDHLSELDIGGGGRVSITDSGPDASLGTLHVTGSTTLASARRPFPSCAWSQGFP